MIATLQLADFALALTWTMLRVGGVILVAPVFGAAFVPMRIRVLATVVLAFALMPMAGPLPQASPIELAGIGAVMREIAVGLAIGFPLRIVVDGAIIAGQMISTPMGLSFATVVDPQNGGMPMLGRLYLIIATLLMLATNAHLALIGLLGQSYALLPVGSAILTGDAVWAIVTFGSQMFVGAMYLALPAVVSIVSVNIAFGVISRAAPTLNLFAVGFPVTLLMGFLIMVMTIRGQSSIWENQIQLALKSVSRLLGG